MGSLFSREAAGTSDVGRREKKRVKLIDVDISLGALSLLNTHTHTHTHTICTLII